MFGSSGKWLTLVTRYISLARFDSRGHLPAMKMNYREMRTLTKPYLKVPLGKSSDYNSLNALVLAPPLTSYRKQNDYSLACNDATSGYNSRRERGPLGIHFKLSTLRSQLQQGSSLYMMKSTGRNGVRLAIQLHAPVSRLAGDQPDSEQTELPNGTFAAATSTATCCILYC